MSRDATFFDDLFDFAEAQPAKPEPDEPALIVPLPVGDPTEAVPALEQIHAIEEMVQAEEEAEAADLAAGPRAAGDTGVAAVDAVQDTMFPELATATSSLAARLIVPPFTVLDTTAHYWRQRRSAWLALGIKSELGRGEELVYQTKHILKAERYGRGHMDPVGRQVNQDGQPDTYTAGTSVFDPVLCEIAYRWFCPPGGSVLDPFAGGSVRGVVAGMLGRDYLGIDLRGEQVAANEAQWGEIGPVNGAPGHVTWRKGDSRNVRTMLGDERVDMLFTCPPYFNLERYSDNPQDLSNASGWEGFCSAYRTIIRDSLWHLRHNRASVWIVGNLRDDRGRLLDLVGLTVQAHEEAGAMLYNDAVLLNAIGSLPVRTAAQFPGGRKMGRRHQVCLVFWKGDPTAVGQALGPIEGWVDSDLVPKEGNS